MHFRIRDVALGQLHIRLRALGESGRKAGNTLRAKVPRSFSLAFRGHLFRHWISLLQLTWPPRPISC